MGVFELISAILLVLSCIFIIVIVFFQGSQKGGMSQTITGQSSDNYYQRNMGRSKEMRLKKLTVVAAALFFAVAVAVNLIAARFPEGFGGGTPPPPPENGYIGEATGTDYENYENGETPDINGDEVQDNGNDDNGDNGDDGDNGDEE